MCTLSVANHRLILQTSTVPVYRVILEILPCLHPACLKSFQAARPCNPAILASTASVLNTILRSCR